MSRTAEPDRGGLYRMDADLTTERILHHVTVSNGLDRAPGGRTVYYVDSAQ